MPTLHDKKTLGDLCEVCEGFGWDWKKAADDDLQVDDPVDTYFCVQCNGKGTINANSTQQIPQDGSA